MSIDFTDADENAVSDGTTLPEQPCTDGLPDSHKQQAVSETTSSADASSTESTPHKTTTVFEQIHVGNLTLTVDDPEFAYAVQCGILFAQHHYHKSTVSMREVLQRLVERLEDEMDENGHIEDYTRPLGEIFGEISHLLTGIKRLHVYFNPYGSTSPIE